MTSSHERLALYAGTVVSHSSFHGVCGAIIAFVLQLQLEAWRDQDTRYLVVQFFQPTLHRPQPLVIVRRDDFCGAPAVVPVKEHCWHPLEHFMGQSVLVTESVVHCVSHLLQRKVSDFGLGVLYFVATFTSNVIR